MGECTRESMLINKGREKECLNLRMGMCTLESGRMIRWLDKVLIFLLKEIFIREIL